MTRAARSLCLVVLGALSACDVRDVRREADSAAPAQLASMPSDTPRGRVTLARLGTIGRTATPEEIRAWDIDVNGTGVGLPPGSGSWARGAEVFARQCASCHGPKGEGMATNPRLIGAEPRDFSFALDPKLPKTIGNYWPYATTIYDYVSRAMPFNAPGTLTPDETYSIVAFLLVENDIIARGTVVDARSLPRIRMPARDRFVVDNRTGGPVIR